MTLYDKLLKIMLDAGLSEDSSSELAFHMSLHYPEHSAALLGERVSPEEPPPAT